MERHTLWCLEVIPVSAFSFWKCSNHKVCQTQTLNPGRLHAIESALPTILSLQPPWTFWDNFEIITKELQVCWLMESTSKNTTFITYHWLYIWLVSPFLELLIKEEHHNSSKSEAQFKGFLLCLVALLYEKYTKMK